jgi:hypothetical protein
MSFKGFPGTVEEDVAIDNRIVEPRPWNEGAEGVLCEGDGPHLAQFFHGIPVWVEGRLDKVRLVGCESLQRRRAG